MATQVQYRRGTTAQHSTFAGAAGELTIDTDKDTIVVHDGSTVGGFPAMRQLENDVAPVLGGNLDLNGKELVGDLILQAPTVPATASDPGAAGQISWDADFVYVCVSANTWKRAALATW